MKQNLALLVCATLVALLLLEGGIALGARLGLFRIKIPGYSLMQARSPIFWRDVDPDFGVWHLANSATRHTKGCFDHVYRSNAYGARDRERTLESDRPRVVVLGDSMTEGFGVSDERRYSYLLERETGLEHLNFATTGSFGTIQYFLLYKALATRFSHSAVLIGMTPDNDFWDNDYDYGKRVFADRYRPYLLGEYPHYHLVYGHRALEDSAYRDRAGLSGLLQRLLVEFTHTYNAIHYFRLLVAWQSVERKGAPAGPDEAGAARDYAGYYDYRQDQLDLAKYTFEQIKRLAGERRVIIALLPAPADFRRYDPAVTPPLSAEMARFAAANGMEFVDLLPAMLRQAKDWKSLILSCDNHWNEQGHAAAARELRAALDRVYASLAR